MTNRLVFPLLSALSLLLAACGGDGGSSGADLAINPNLFQPENTGNYSGPPPATADVQAFKLNVWDNLAAANRCGGCHGTGGQTPQFVRSDDINQAYGAANTVVNLASPAESRMVTKVGGGHNCWLASTSACADIITTYIQNWAGGSAGQTKTIEFTAPPLRDPGTSKNFPADSSLFGTYVHPLLMDYCSDCHTETAATPRAPYFAQTDVDAAYQAAQSKIDLMNPANSRFVLRLGSEFHNCWSNCSSNASEMESAIQQMADGIPLTAVDPDYKISKALTLLDGIIASSGGRFETNQIALWEFKTMEGNVAYDTSGIDPAIDLTFSDGSDITWVGGWGINIASGRAQGTTAASSKLYDQILATGEYSIEAWLAPANVTQEGPARIISYAGSANARNFMVGQTLYNYDYLNNSSTTDGAGQPALSTPDDDEVLQATLQHVVVTFDPVNGRRIYVNGEDTGVADGAGGLLNTWNNSYAFVLGNEVSSSNANGQWKGVIRMVAIHNRALTPEQIQGNFEVGVGEKFFLLFSVSDLVGIADSFILVEASQFDSYSYLFNQPRFITLTPDADPSGIVIEGMRIGINGKLATVGQAYRNMSVVLDVADYGETGILLSPLATVIPLEQGPAGDEFFLQFDRIGSETFVVVEPVPSPPAAPGDLPAESDIGIKTFAEINATMATLTGVGIDNSTAPQTFIDRITEIRDTYDLVEQQLPTVEKIGGFLSAHQIATAQLAIEYCNALVNDTTLRNALFDSSLFTQNANDISDYDWQNGLVDPMINRFMGTNLLSQPAVSDVRDELMTLITSTDDIKPIIMQGETPTSMPDGQPDGLAKCGGSCPAGQTELVAKAACAALLGSAVMLVQ